MDNISVIIERVTFWAVGISEDEGWSVLNREISQPSTSTNAFKISIRFGY